MEKQETKINEAAPEQVDTLQEYIGYLEDREDDLTRQLDKVRTALEEATAFAEIRNSAWVGTTRKTPAPAATDAGAE